MYKQGTKAYFLAETGFVNGSSVIGIQEDFDTSHSAGKSALNVTFGVGMNTLPLPPIILRGGEFITLAEYLRSCPSVEEGLTTLCKSHKPVFSYLPNTLLVCHLSGSIDDATGEWSREPTFTYYIPLGLGELKPEQTGNKSNRLCVETETVTASGAMSTVQLSKPLLNAVTYSIKQRVVPYVKKKEQFWLMRAGLL